MQFIKYHWFGLLVSLIVFFFLFIFFLVLIAPHQDEQERGFVPCTRNMAEQVQQCAGAKGCILKAVVENTFCNIRIVGQGAKLWAQGKQPRPWSNYLFRPELAGGENSEELDEFYRDSPDVENQMKELQKLNEELEMEYEKRTASGLESE